MSPKDPRWLGAWWLGFLVFGLLGLIVGIPLAFFPRRFHAKHVTEAQSQVTSNKYKLIKDVKGLLRVLLRLVLNPVYVCIILSNGVNLMCVSGFLAFMPKYLETQFNIPAWQANMYLGAMNIAAAFVGTILGGCMATRLNLSPLSCLKAVVISKCLGALLGATGFFTGCSQPVFQSSSFESIAEEDKPLAIGLSSFSGTLLGWFPGPIIFGSLIDTTCLMWKKNSQSTGACLLYNIDQFRIRFHALVVGLRMISIILCCTAL
ncbi:hypothetical protein Btru_010449 [Bulinus truncatus]|nr:hypothetical protein Btru_010449 [Bulinus truncatus]